MSSNILNIHTYVCIYIYTSIGRMQLKRGHWGGHVISWGGVLLSRGVH